LGRPAARWAACGLGQPLLIDLPGNGHARELPVPGDVAAWRRRCATRRGIGPDGPWRILAMSLGAMVATSWAQAWPADVAQLVLINTSMRPFSTATERLRPQNWAALIGMASHWHDRARCERTVHRLTCERLDTRDADLSRWVEIGLSAPVSRRSAMRQLIAAARFRAQPTAPACPTLIVSSDADRLVHPVCSARLAGRGGRRMSIRRGIRGQATTCRTTTPNGCATRYPASTPSEKRRMT
jgi:pimeloyl-ACP methyl ester carboxylesterase